MTAAISIRQLEIIEAAGKILTTSGVGGLTIKNLANEMKFSESALYRHFTGKEAIIISLLEYLTENIDQRLEKVISTDSNPEENFRAIFRNQFNYFKKHPHFIVAVFSDGLMEESQKINETILKIMQVKMKHLLPVIIAGQNEGLFTEAITAKELAHIILGTFRLQMFQWRADNFQFDIQRRGEKIIEALLVLIKSK